MSQKGGYMATQEQGAEMLSRKDMTEILPGSAGFEMQGGNLLSSGDPQQSDVSSAGQSAASTGLQRDTGLQCGAVS